jgi:hypothetical protein
MSGCHEPLGYLKQFGYSALELPKVRVMPLGLLVRADGPATWTGSVQNFLVCRRKPPQPSTSKDTIKIKGEAWASQDYKINLKILANILSIFGKGLGLSFGYEKARKVQFMFEDVEETGIEPGVVAKYLNSCQIQPDSIIYDWVDPEKYQAFIITGVLRSNSISIEAKADGGGQVGIDVPAISDAVSLGVKVKNKTGAHTWVEYKGTERRTFGFQCHRVWVSKKLERLRMEPVSQPAVTFFARAMTADFRFGAKKIVFEPTVLKPDGLLDLEIMD